MPKVVYTAAKGLVQEAGSGVSLESSPFSPVQAKTASFTIGAPGVYTLTAGAIMTGTMPLASEFPGGVFVFRNGDNNGNVLTGSAENAGVKVFKGVITGSEAQSEGSKLALKAFAGASVALLSDGKNYLVMANSGSLTFSGT